MSTSERPTADLVVDVVAVAGAAVRVVAADATAAGTPTVDVVSGTSSTVIACRIG